MSYVLSRFSPSVSCCSCCVAFWSALLVWQTYPRWFQPQPYSKTSQTDGRFLTLSRMPGFSLMPAHILACLTPLPRCPPDISNLAEIIIFVPRSITTFSLGEATSPQASMLNFPYLSPSQRVSPVRILPAPRLSSFFPHPPPLALILFHLLTRFF